MKGAVKLTTVTIAETVTEISSTAFSGCTIVSAVNYRGFSQPKCSNAFKDSTKSITVKVPSTYKDSLFCGLGVSKTLEL